MNTSKNSGAVSGPVLGPEDLKHFKRYGYVRVRQAFGTDAALRMADAIWDEFRQEYGIVRDDPATWFQPARAPRRAKKLRMNRELASPRLRAAISELRNQEDWPEPKDWGGFLVTFPDANAGWDIPTDTWHWDGGPEMPGPFIFMFFSEVRPGGGGTLILSGSNRLLIRFYAALTSEERTRPHKAHRRMFSQWHPWLAALTGQPGAPAVEDRIATFMNQATPVHGVEVQVVELCGEPGDAVFCSPLILHAIAPNRSRTPRIMRSKFFYS